MHLTSRWKWKTSYLFGTRHMVPLSSKANDPKARHISFHQSTQSLFRPNGLTWDFICNSQSIWSVGTNLFCMHLHCTLYLQIGWRIYACVHDKWVKFETNWRWWTSNGLEREGPDSSRWICCVFTVSDGRYLWWWCRPYDGCSVGYRGFGLPRHGKIALLNHYYFRWCQAKGKQQSMSSSALMCACVSAKYRLPVFGKR